MTSSWKGVGNLPHPFEAFCDGWIFAESCNPNGPVYQTRGAHVRWAWPKAAPLLAALVATRLVFGAQSPHRPVRDGLMGRASQPGSCRGSAPETCSNVRFPPIAAQEVGRPNARFGRS
jgi:hypothetical protein